MGADEERHRSGPGPILELGLIESPLAKPKPAWRPVVLLSRVNAEGRRMTEGHAGLHSASTGALLSIAKEEQVCRGPGLPRGTVQRPGRGFYQTRSARMLIDGEATGPLLGLPETAGVRGKVDQGLFSEPESPSGGRSAIPSLPGGPAPGHWRRKVHRSERLCTAYHLRMKELDASP
mmetsp:Transcript_26705/g.60311  ORF Transcript_26705/g.60311 Transcript_26705/m.60311 type:complete len:177 (-) Transcript_26705:48-578(-)